MGRQKQAYYRIEEDIRLFNIIKVWNLLESGRFLLIRISEMAGLVYLIQKRELK